MAAKGKNYYHVYTIRLLWTRSGPTNLVPMRSGCPGLGSVYLHMGPLTCSPLPGLSKLQEVREVQTLPTCSIVAH